ncbi:hypothetical protein [Xylophilus sp. GOD-11R]|uniref:hypothetical protein n=1 Tax=Xylophilus sp. GOD-11R TaxID=3089814 RepID=UPI00298BDD45|nr:hypothetical protein [Xylophilus sp. GOD-11R]WPB59243.1 hypothetical protein R9X41_11580 [Xylophilus sp. GOD-11R]
MNSTRFFGTIKNSSFPRQPADSRQAVPHAPPDAATRASTSSPTPLDALSCRPLAASPADFQGKVAGKTASHGTDPAARLFEPYVWAALAAVLEFGYFPYDGRKPANGLHTRPDLARGFREFVRRAMVEAWATGRADVAQQLRRIARESVLLDDGRMMFVNGTKLAFHDMPTPPGGQSLIAVNFGGMSANRVDSRNLTKRYLGDIPTTVRQGRHVLQSALSRRPTSNTLLVRLLADYLRTRPESFFAYGHSMGGALGRHLSDELVMPAGAGDAMAPKPVAFVAFQSADLQVPSRAPPTDPESDAVRACHVQSPADPLQRFLASSFVQRITGARVAPRVGTSIDVLAGHRASGLKQHDRIYPLLHRELNERPAYLPQLLEQMERAYAYSCTPSSAGSEVGFSAATWL